MFIGVDVGGSVTSAGLVTADGEVIRVAHTPTLRDGPGTAVESLIRVVDEILAGATELHLAVTGLGIGLPGIVDVEAGRMQRGLGLIPELSDTSLAERVQARAGVPVFVDNDVNAQALAESAWGVGRGYSSMVVLALGSGVGGALILDGRLMRGRNGYTGEFGHVSVKLDGPRCLCGIRGCLSVYTSGNSIALEGARRAAVAAGRPAADPSREWQPQDSRAVFAAAAAGDSVAGSVVEDCCQALGVGLGGLVNGLNPEVIAVTGGVVGSLMPYQREILDCAARYALPGALAGTRIRFVPGDKTRTVRGGAALVLYEQSRRAAPTAAVSPGKLSPASSSTRSETPNRRDKETAMAEHPNDVDLTSIKQFDEAVRANPELGKLTCKVQSTWERGTKAFVTVGPIHGLGQNLFPRTRSFVVMSDDPPALGGVDSAPAPIETLLAALCGCVTSGVATNAALFGIPLDAIDIAMEADLDARGVLGHDKSVPNGLTDIRYTVTIKSPAAEDKVRRCKETIDRKSPVRSTLANPVNITSTLVFKPS
jgi:glucokinase